MTAYGIAPYLRSGPTDNHLQVTEPIYSQHEALSAEFVDFQTEDSTAGLQQYEDYTVITRHGLVRIEHDSKHIATINQGRWSLLISGFDAVEVIRALPTWINQVEQDEATTGIPSQQFWHELSKVTGTICALGCNPLVAPSAFPIALRSWSVQEGWRLGSPKIEDGWPQRGVVLNFLTKIPQEQKAMCTKLPKTKRWFVLTRSKSLD